MPRTGRPKKYATPEEKRAAKNALERARYAANREERRARDNAKYAARARVSKPITEAKRAYNRAYREANREKLMARDRAYAEEHSEEQRLRHKKRYEANKKEMLSKSREYMKERCKRDPAFKLRCRLRTRLFIVVRRARTSRSVSAIRDIGCSPAELVKHIEDQFLPGMSWDTWGNVGPNAWHIDHVEPLSAFDLSDREQLLRACHYTNLRPLWALDNIRKGGVRKGRARHEQATMEAQEARAKG